jgi:hypothetical protein
MAQKTLPYQYAIEESKVGLTSFGGGADVSGSCGSDGVTGLNRPASEDTDRGSRMDGPADDLITGVIKSGGGRLRGGHR